MNLTPYKRLVPERHHIKHPNLETYSFIGAFTIVVALVIWALYHYL